MEWSLTLFAAVLAVDVLAVCCGVLLFVRHRRRSAPPPPSTTSSAASSSSPAAAAHRDLPASADSRTTCVEGAPLAFRARSCALDFGEGGRARVLIEGDADLSGAAEFTINMVLGLHAPMAADGPAGVLCDIDGVLSVVVSRMRVGFRVCQIAPLEDDAFAWSAPLAAGRWYLVSCVFARGTMTVYVDGVALARSRVHAPHTHYCGPIRALQLGAEGSAAFQGQFFAGAVAHVEVWRRAFSRADVAAIELMSCEAVAARTHDPAFGHDSLALLYSLEHVDEQCVCDESGRGYHGEMDWDAPRLVLIECAPPAPRPAAHSPATAAKRGPQPRPAATKHAATKHAAPRSPALPHKHAAAAMAFEPKRVASELRQAASGARRRHVLPDIVRSSAASS